MGAVPSRISRENSKTQQSEVASDPAPVEIPAPTQPKQLNLDSCISRLLETRRKTSKTLCIKQQEILAICLAVREVVMEQPMLLELLVYILLSD